MTQDGSANSEYGPARDYEATEGRLFFGNGQRDQTISINIMNDQIAEGPEDFFVNLTTIELLDPT